MGKLIDRGLLGVGSKELEQHSIGRGKMHYGSRVVNATSFHTLGTSAFESPWSWVKALFGHLPQVLLTVHHTHTAIAQSIS